MKRLFLIMISLIMILLLNGCHKVEPQSTQSVEEQSAIEDFNAIEDKATIEISDLKTDEIETINLYIPYFDSEKKMSEKDIVEWENYIYEKFNYSINLKNYYYMSKEGIKEFGDTFNDGIIYFPNEATYERLIKDAYIAPLNEYMARYSINSESYHKAVALLTQSDGKVYSIPTFYEEFYLSKEYNADYLEDVNLNEQFTLDEYIKLGEKLKENDIYLMIYNDSLRSFYNAFYDVFAAFGCYVVDDINDGIIYNPIDEIYELAILNDNYGQAIEYIKTLMQLDYVYAYKGDVGDKKSISYSHVNNKYINDNAKEIELGLFLKGTSSEYKIQTNNYANGFAILNGSGDIDEKMSFIFDVLFKNEDLRYAFTHGHENNYKIVDHVINVNHNLDASCMINAPYIRFSMFENDFKVSYTNEVPYDGKTEKADALLNDIHINHSEDDFFYIRNHERSEGNITMVTDLKEAANEFYISVFNNNVNIKTAIENYKNAVTKTSAIEYLEKLNENNE